MVNIEPIENTDRPVGISSSVRRHNLEEVTLPKPTCQLGAVTLPDTIDIPYVKAEPEASRFETIKFAALKRYDQASIAIKPRLADARIVIGALAVLTGIAGLTSLFIGVHLPFIRFLKRHMTLSIAFSLIIIQTGLSSIHQGVCYKDTEWQLQQEAQRVRALYEIERRELHAADRPIPIHTRAEVESLESTLPNLTPPGESTTIAPSPETQALFESKWSTWWRKHLPFLGKMQLVNGTLMLGVGLVALSFMFSSHIPPGLSKIGPLSVSFSCVLIANWIYSAREGWQMMNYEKQNKKRAREVEQLQLINKGLKALEQLELKEEDRRALQAHIEQTFLAEEPNNPSWLSTPSILLGIGTTVLAGVFLTMIYTGHVPSSLSILTKNTPLSTLFVGSLSIYGMKSIYDGAEMSESAQRLSEKNRTARYREALLKHFAQYKPILPNVKRSSTIFPRALSEVELDALPQYVEEKERMQTCMNQIVEKRPNAFQRLLLESLRGLWVPQALWGTLLLAAGIASITFAFGAPIPHAFGILAGHQGYTLAQSLSLLGVAFLALETSYNMGTYHSYKEVEQEEQKLIAKAYERLIGRKRVAQVKLHA